MIELLQQRLNTYKAANPIEEVQATREIFQEVALYALWRAGFFEVAAFQGGASLRILHGLQRFSEDLGFILKAPDPGFQWNPYLEKLLTGLLEFGLHSEAVDKSRMDQNVKRALLRYFNPESRTMMPIVWPLSLPCSHTEHSVVSSVNRQRIVPRRKSAAACQDFGEISSCSTYDKKL